MSKDDRVEVITARGDSRYLYDLAGRLLSKEHDEAAESTFPEGEAHLVPTAFWLWVFSSPFYSWLSAMVGLLLIAAGRKSGGVTKP
jgi:YD repeat-containing protein